GLEGGAVAYARHLSEPELRALLAWSRSDVGKAINAKMPAIMLDMLAQQTPLMKKIVTGVMRTAADKACQEIACTGAERETIALILEKGASQPAS
uniref:DUF2059 domain-containing protein n=1 Tax=Phenylobacterium sp. TaxID=1871053 RepID=UPI00286B925B